MKKISVIMPAYNEEGAIASTLANLCAFADSTLVYEWEFIVVDDGSIDNTAQIVNRLHQSDSRINCLSLSRNFGKENALLAGMDFVSGDATLIMDADGQHSLDVVPQMIDAWAKEQVDDVYAMRQSRQTDSAIRRLFSRAYYRILCRMSDVEVLPGAGDFRLLDRRCVNAIRSLRENARYTKGLYSWVGFKKKGIAYTPAERTAGHSSFSARRLVNLAIDGITSHTTAPLRISSVVGVFVSLLAFIYLIFTIFKTLIYGEPVQGYPTLICAILFLGGIQLLSIGIIGEYVGRTFIESKRRPPYIADRLNGEKLD